MQITNDSFKMNIKNRKYPILSDDQSYLVTSFYSSLKNKQMAR